MSTSLWKRMLHGDFTPQSSKAIAVLLIATSCVQAITLGFDGSMMNGLNILPSYSDYFHLTNATTSLNTAAMSIGGCLSIVYSKMGDATGRKFSLFLTAIITIIAVVIQTAAQNTGMFVVGRILVGFANGCSGLVGPVYVSETLPAKWRGWGLAIYYDLWYAGALIAAGVTFGSSTLDSTWSWRTPSAIQCLFSFIAIFLLPFVPESPRWLIDKGRNEEAFDVLALTYADGDREDPSVLTVYKEITDTLAWEKENGEQLSFKECFRTPGNRLRILLSSSVALFEALSGNAIATWYLGTMLDNAGITNTRTQLKINIILNAWCFVCALGGTYFVDKLGRKKLALLSTGLCTVFIFLVGALTKVYGETENTSGIYATLALIFLFQGSYSIGWTPLTVLYPPEVLNYSIRSTGMGIYQFLTFGFILMTTFSYEFALDAIGYKLYMINGAWDVLEFIFVAVFWIETTGKTLEEIDASFDGVKHSDAPDLDIVLKKGTDIGMLEGVDPMNQVTARNPSKPNPGTKSEV